MNYLMVDISGKVIDYDVALCEAMFKHLKPNDNLVFFSTDILPKIINCPSKKLFSIVPTSFKSSENKLKRGLKAF